MSFIDACDLFVWLVGCLFVYLYACFYVWCVFFWTLSMANKDDDNDRRQGRLDINPLWFTRGVLEACCSVNRG